LPRRAFGEAGSLVNTNSQARLLLRQLADRKRDVVKLSSSDRLIELLQTVITSFALQSGKGLPLGNLTSQLFVNIYMNEFDQWMKHTMKVKYYIRYADDFVILSQDKQWLEELLPQMQEFLGAKLFLTIHPNKVYLKTLASGVDFLGWVHFPQHRVLRTSTKRRMFSRIGKRPTEATVQSYIGLLIHGNTYGLQGEVITCSNHA